MNNKMHDKAMELIKNGTLSDMPTIYYLLEVSKMIGNETSETPADHAQDELDGAREYLALREDTGDSAYSTMATDELRHAAYFIGKVTDPMVKAKLKAAHDALIAKI